MSVTEIEKAVKALPPEQAHEFCRWFFREYSQEAVLPDQALCELGDQLFVAMDKEEDAYPSTR